MQNDQEPIDQAKILKDYERQGAEIMRQMLSVLKRAQKKINNASYQKQPRET